MVRFVIDGLLNNRPFFSLLGFVLAVTVVQLVFEASKHVIWAYISEPYGIKISAGINKEIFNKVMHTDLKHLDTPKFYDAYTWTLQNLVNQCTQMANLVVGISSTLVRIVTLVFLISTTDIFVIIFAIFNIVFTATLYRIIAKLKYEKDIETLQINRRWGYLGRIFYLKNFSFDLRSTNLSKILFSRFSKNVEDSLSLVKKYRPSLSALDIITGSASIIFYSAVFVYLGFRAHSSNISIGDFSAMLVAFGLLRDGLSSIADEFVQLYSMELYTVKAKNFMDSESSIETKNISNTILKDNPFHIVFKNVSFKYKDGDAPCVFNDLSLEIRPGQKIAIVGQNGAGKTTLLKLLLGFYEVNKGDIFIDGTKIPDINLQDLRSKIGVAFQQSYVYAESIRQNLLLYSESIDSEEVTDEQMVNILNKLNLNILVNDAVTLETEMTREFDGNGVELSGGQTQLFALARLFIKKFNLLILDEPSSALDPLMEYRLNKIIIDEFKDETVVIIAHRLSTIRNVDCIYLLHEGTVAEMGTHEELMVKKGIYCDMFTKQAENYTI